MIQTTGNCPTRTTSYGRRNTQYACAVLEGQFTNQRVLVLIPDHTRSLPLPFLFRALVEILHDAKQLDFMVALGTHPPLSEESLNQLVGITAEERNTQYATIGLLNHAWDDPSALTSLGIIEQDQIKQIAGDHLAFVPANRSGHPHQQSRPGI